MTLKRLKKQTAWPLPELQRSRSSESTSTTRMGEIVKCRDLRTPRDIYDTSRRPRQHNTCRRSEEPRRSTVTDRPVRVGPALSHASRWVTLSPGVPALSSGAPPLSSRVVRAAEARQLPTERRAARDGNPSADLDRLPGRRTDTFMARVQPGEFGGGAAVWSRGSPPEVWRTAGHRGFRRNRLRSALRRTAWCNVCACVTPYTGVTIAT